MGLNICIKELCRLFEILHTRQRDYGWEKTHMCMVFAHALDRAPSTPARNWCHLVVLSIISLPIMGETLSVCLTSLSYVLSSGLHYLWLREVC
jgi:uncharacterized membrane protein